MLYWELFKSNLTIYAADKWQKRISEHFSLSQIYSDNITLNSIPLDVSGEVVHQVLACKYIFQVIIWNIYVKQNFLTPTYCNPLNVQKFYVT